MDPTKDTDERVEWNDCGTAERVHWGVPAEHGEWNSDKRHHCRTCRWTTFFVAAFTEHIPCAKRFDAWLPTAGFTIFGSLLSFDADAGGGGEWKVLLVSLCA